MESVIDFAADYSADAPAFYAAGVRDVMRYIAKPTARPGKAITAAEAKRWLAAKVGFGLVYQDRGGSGGADNPRGHIEDFSESIGAQQAARALAVAKEIGFPTGCAIYCAVDHDFSSKTDLVTLVTHFKAFAASIRAAGYRVGGYGSGLVTQTLREAGAIDLIWLGGAYGWQGSRKAKDAGIYDLLQAPQKKGSIAGKSIDYDPNKPRAQDFGQWEPGAGSKPAPIPPPPAPPAPRILKLGDEGEDVKPIQRALRLKEDGDYGEKTEIAVTGFEIGARITIDGKVGPEVRAALHALNLL